MFSSAWVMLNLIVGCGFGSEEEQQWCQWLNLYLDLDLISINKFLPCSNEIVISQNGTSPSECWHSLCRYKKGQIGLKLQKHYICAWTLMHYPQTSLIYFYFEFWVAYTTMCIVTRVSYVSICIATCVYLAYASSLWETHVSYAPCLY